MPFIPAATAVCFLAQMVRSISSYHNGLTAGFADIGPYATLYPPISTNLRFFVDPSNGFDHPNVMDSTGFTFRMGRDLLIIGFNGDTTPLSAGELVFIDTNPTNQIALFMKRAKADSLSTLPAIGCVITPMEVGQRGRILRFGRSEANLNTAGFSAGDILYVSPFSAGRFTNIKPSYPHYNQQIGYSIVIHPVTGIIGMDPFGVLQSFSWSSARNTVDTYSASWIDTRTTFNQNSAIWNNTRNTLSTTSASWVDTRNTVQANSSYWGERICVKTTNQIFSTVHLSAVNDLLFYIEANKKYSYRFIIDYNTSHTQEGIVVSLSGPPSPTMLRYFANITDGDRHVTHGIGKAYNFDIPSQDGPGPSLSAIGQIWGFVFNGPNPGYLQLLAKTELSVASRNSTMNAGSYGTITEVRDF